MTGSGCGDAGADAVACQDPVSDRRRHTCPRDGAKRCRPTACRIGRSARRKRFAIGGVATVMVASDSPGDTSAGVVPLMRRSAPTWMRERISFMTRP
jgi:hypothetical protein